MNKGRKTYPEASLHSAALNRELHQFERKDLSAKNLMQKDHYGNSVFHYAARVGCLYQIPRFSFTKEWAASCGDLKNLGKEMASTENLSILNEYGESAAEHAEIYCLPSWISLSEFLNIKNKKGQRIIDLIVESNTWDDLLGYDVPSEFVDLVPREWIERNDKFKNICSEYLEVSPADSFHFYHPANLAKEGKMDLLPRPLATEEFFCCRRFGGGNFILLEIAFLQKIAEIPRQIAKIENFLLTGKSGITPLHLAVESGDIRQLTPEITFLDYSKHLGIQTFDQTPFERALSLGNIHQFFGCRLPDDLVEKTRQALRPTQVELESYDNTEWENFEKLMALK